MSVDHDSSCGPSGSSCKRRNDLAPSVWLSRGELIHHLLLKEEDFEDTWRWSAGVTYQYDEKLTLRAGYAYDEGAVSFAHRSLSIPDTDRHWVSAGATWALTDDTSVDMAYVYIKGREAAVSQQRAIGSIVSDLTATEHAKAQILSVQINTAF